MLTEWTEDQLITLTRYYVEKALGAAELKLRDVAALIGKDPAVVTRKATALGLTSLKGCLSLTPQVEMDLDTALAARAATTERVGGLWRGECPVPLLPLKTSPQSSKMRERTIGGKTIAIRSGWEANYAQYLELLKASGVISEWEYEPETFWFHRIRSGTRNYLPDFRVQLPDGTLFYVEVKGWMDQKSETRLKRMAAYYPAVAVFVVAKDEMVAIKKKYSSLMPNWEAKKRKK